MALTNKTGQTMDEFTIIELIRSQMREISPLSAHFTTDDDGAILENINQSAIISVDDAEEGVHFPRKAPPFLIGYRAVMMAASDLAAMGASPRAMLLALRLPLIVDEQSTPVYHSREYLTALTRGVGTAAARVSMAVIGGNITRSASLGLSCIVIGEGGKYLSRYGARVGDDIYVSGTLGDAAAGLEYAEIPPQYLPPSQAGLRARYYCPSPRLHLGKELIGVANSAIDISDGLVADLTTLLGGLSGLGAEVFLNALPYSKHLIHETAKAEREKLALYSGDNYELLFTSPRKNRKKIKELGNKHKLHHVGVVNGTAKIVGVKGDGKENKERILKSKQGYRHFI